jgi:hypothetical protein
MEVISTTLTHSPALEWQRGSTHRTAWCKHRPPWVNIEGVTFEGVTRVLMVTMAGEEAEVVLLGASRFGSVDRQEVQHVLPHLLRDIGATEPDDFTIFERHLRRRTRRLIANRRNTLQRLAAKLIERTSLDAAEVQRLLRSRGDEAGQVVGHHKARGASHPQPHLLAAAGPIIASRGCGS